MEVPQYQIKLIN